MRKVPLEIEDIGGEIMDDGLNKITKVTLKYKVGDYEGRIDDVREINDFKYSDKYLCTNLMLSIIDSYACGIEFNNFETPKDMADFFQMFGYCGDSKSCEKGFEVLSELKEINNELKKYWGELSFEEVDKYRDIYSDGEPKKVLGMYDELVEKYFDFDFKKNFK